ncbi:MAG: apolipoprotein A1/A4/E family protein [Bacteroidales bacterium]|nr:apolipoprotein A1/A4/E family protein [Bacteroidales bacterium]
MLNNVKERMGGVFERVKETVSEKFSTIKETVSEKFSGVKERIGGVLNNVKERMGGVFERVRETVSSAPSVPGLSASVQKETLRTSGRAATAVSGVLSAGSSSGLSVSAAAGLSPVSGAEAVGLSPLRLQPVYGESRVGAVSSDRVATARFDRFCDRVDIHLPAGTPGEQAELLLNELMRRINDAVA